MTVKLSGYGNLLPVVEHDVESVSLNGAYIEIHYKAPYKYGAVSGVRYDRSLYAIKSCREENEQ